MREPTRLPRKENVPAGIRDAKRDQSGGNEVHFYEKSAKGYVSADGWDVQRIDMGIALAHFELAAKESGRAPVLMLENPGIPTAPDTAYTATFIC